MRKLLAIPSLAALAWLVGAAVLGFAGRLDFDEVKRQLLLATILWFVAAPWWMARERG
jgi:hypothetical protein